MNKFFLYTLFLLLILLCLAIFYPANNTLLNFTNSNFNTSFNRHFKHTPSFDAIYVFGGSQQSLQKKFQVAAKMYKSHLSNLILFLYEKGKTSYSASLGRNFTNTEWSIFELHKLGVNTEDILPIFIGDYFFGTYREARGISGIAIQKNYTNLILITAPYHTERVRLCIAHFLQDTNINFTIICSNEPAHFFDIVEEQFKLIVYHLFLL